MAIDRHLSLRSSLSTGFARREGDWSTNLHREYCPAVHNQPELPYNPAQLIKDSFRGAKFTESRVIQMFTEV